MIAICEWIPHHDPYTGTPTAAVMAFTDIPLVTRITLIERIKRNDYTETVSIHKTEIVARNAYEPGIRSMHFGSKGQLCGTVTRAKWRDSDTQGAIAYCEGETCVIRPAVCNNWAIVRRISTGQRESLAKPQADSSTNERRDAAIPVLGTFEGYGDGSAYGYVLPTVRGSEPLPLSPEDLTPELWSNPSESPFVVSGPGFPPFLPPYCPTITPSVPEPSTWALYLAGILAIWLYALRKRK